ncbi:uncharacterized protein LOC124537114 [Vanessa cardui]|uniref:uncharacterized protein LOC124537114 n=1 Tax=Vanessa cardui TaxID=171605 RepID=UPI001F138986|nr:uncharacterized protein LOC124537114 [Vanessa cardui]
MIPNTSALRECASTSRTNNNFKYHQYLHVEERCNLSIENCGRSDTSNLGKASVCSLRLERHIYRNKTSSPTELTPDKDTRSVHTQTDPDDNSSKEEVQDYTEERHSEKRKYSAVQDELVEPSIRISRVTKQKTNAGAKSEETPKSSKSNPPRNRLRERMLSAIVQNERLISEIDTYEKNIKEEKWKKKFNRY